MANVKQTLDRFSKAVERRRTWEPIWRECFDYTMPNRDGLNTSVAGQRRDDLIFDETAVVGVQEFASRMVQGIVPNNTQWTRFEVPPEIRDQMGKDQADEAQSQYDKTTERTFSFIQESNFSSEAHESFLDLAIGTGNIVCEKGDLLQPLKFTSVPIHEAFLESGPFDRVEGQYRARMVRAQDIPVIWPHGTLPPTAAKLIADGKPQERVKILEATHRDWADTTTECYYHAVIDVAAKSPILQTEFKGIGSNPWISFRWAKGPGEVYGRGPVFNSLSAIKTANLTVQLILENADMAVAGMWQADDDGVINPHTINLVPGAIIPRATNSRGLEPLEAPGRFDIGDLVLREMRQNINKALYNETLGAREGTPITATEVAERMAELSRQLGAVYGRLQAEFVFPIIKRVVYLLKQQGLIDLPTLNNQEIRLRAVSPMIRAQRNEDISQHINYASVLGQLFGPAVVQTVINPTSFAAKMARWYEIDSEMLYTEEERNQMAQETGQAAADMAANGMDPAQTLRSLLP